MKTGTGNTNQQRPSKLMQTHTVILERMGVYLDHFDVLIETWKVLNKQSLGEKHIVQKRSLIRALDNMKVTIWKRLKLPYDNLIKCIKMEYFGKMDKRNKQVLDNAMQKLKCSIDKFTGHINTASDSMNRELKLAVWYLASKGPAATTSSPKSSKN